MGAIAFKRFFRNLAYKLCHNAVWDFNGIPNSLWWKARKGFVRPKVKFAVINGNNNYIGDYLCPQHGIIIADDVYWKTKWGTYRFEWLPHITIRAFGKCFVWTFESPSGDNSTYYETMLDYLWKYGKDIEKTKENFGWKRLNENNQWVSCWDDSIVRHGS